MTVLSNQMTQHVPVGSFRWLVAGVVLLGGLSTLLSN